MRSRGFTQDDSHIFCTQEQVHDEIRLAARLRARRAARLRLRRVPGEAVDEARWRSRSAPTRTGSRRPTALRTALESGRPRLRRRRGRRRVLRAEDRRRRPRCDRTAVAAVDDPVRLQHARSASSSSTSAPTAAAPARHDPPCPVRVGRAVLRGAGRALRRRLPGLARPGAGPGAAGRRRPHADYAARASSPSSCRGHLRADVVAADESLGKRIRKAKLEKIPYVLVVGDDDVAARTVGVNARGGEVERDVAFECLRPARRRRTAAYAAGLTAVPDPMPLDHSGPRGGRTTSTGASTVDRAELDGEPGEAVAVRAHPGRRRHRRGEAHRAPGPAVLRHAQPVPVHRPAT